MKISKSKDIVGIWGIQDGSGNPSPGWSEYFPTHDHSFCILGKDGNIKTSLELERKTRKKHDYRMSKYIEGFNDLLSDDFIVVSVNHYAGTSFISENGLWRIESNPFDLSDLITETKAYVNRQNREAYICSHELAHIGSILPFVSEFKENSLLVHIDGLASESCFSVFVYKDNKIQYLHHGWEPLDVIQIFGFNDLMTAMLGLDDGHRLATAGRLMGYSSYGTYRKEIRDWLDKNDWYKEYWKKPNSFFDDIEENFGIKTKSFDLKNRFFMDIAATCQKVFEDKIFEIFSDLQIKTGCENLYFSGGSALNINLNTKVFNSGIFERVYIPPCCSDTGLAIGAASIIQKLRRGKINIHSPFLNSIGLEKNKKIKISKEIVEEIVDRLYKKEVMATCIGYGENGPRALGHRSILAVPSSVEMYKQVNTRIKKREWYRPLAPIIMEELAEEVFPGSTKTSMSKYMLCNFKVAESWKNKIPAVVHVDGTARVQVVAKEDKDLSPIYDILRRLWEKYKIPCLINTSFNGPGEPIVHTEEDAFNTGKDLGINFLLVNDKLLELRKG